MSSEAVTRGWPTHQTVKRAPARSASAGKDPATFACQTVTGLFGLRALRSAWVDLERRSSSFVLPFDAIAAVAERTPADGIRIVTVRRGGRLVLVWPFAITRTGPLRRAIRLGRAVQCYDDILLADFASSRDRERTLHFAWREVAHWEEVDCVALSTIKTASHVLDVPAVAAQVRQITQAPRLDLSAFASIEDFRATLSRNRRSSIRRRRKRLEASNTVVFAEARMPTERRSALDQAMTFKRSWLDAHDTVSTAHASDYYAPAFQDIAGLPRCRDDVRIFTLTVGGEVAAVEVGIVSGGVYQSHIGAFSPRWAKFGVGAVLTLDVIGWCISAGLDEYDMLPPDTAFKRDFTDDAAQIYDAVIPLSAFGHLALPFARDGKAIAKRAHAALPVGLRRAASKFMTRQGPTRT